jgi:hypothetical protein
MDTAGSALTHGREPTHPLDPDMIAAISLNMDAKGKSPQMRWLQEHEAMDEELQLTLDLNRREAAALALHALRSPGPPMRRSHAAEMASRLTTEATQHLQMGGPSKGTQPGYEPQALPKHPLESPPPLSRFHPQLRPR